MEEDYLKKHFKGVAVKIIKIEETRVRPINDNYTSCPDCGYPLAPSLVCITEGFFRDTITDGKECMKCGYKITYTYKE